MKGILVCLGAIAAASLSVNAASQEAVQYFPTPPVDGQSLPFSEAVRVGNTLYLAGQVGNAPGTLKLVPGGMRAEARQVMENIKAILERHASSLDRVVKCTVFLTDMKEWAAFNGL